MDNPFQEVRKHIAVDILPEDRKRLSDHIRQSRQLRLVLMILTCAALVSLVLRAWLLWLFLTIADALCAAYRYSAEEDFKKALYDILFERCNASHAQSAYLWNGLNDPNRKNRMRNLFRFGLALYYGGRYTDIPPLMTIMRKEVKTREDQLYLIFTEHLMAYHEKRLADTENYCRDMTRLMSEIKITPFLQQFHMEAQLYPLILRADLGHHYESVYELYENALVLNETKLGQVKKHYHLCVCAEAMGDFERAEKLKDYVLKYGGNLRYVRELEDHRIHPGT